MSKNLLEKPYSLYIEKFPEIVQSSISTLIFREPKKHLYLLAYLFSHHPIYKSLKGQMKMSKVLFTSSPFCVRSPLIGDQNRGEDLKCHWDFSTATELLPPPLWFFRVSKWSNSVKIVQSQKEIKKLLILENQKSLGLYHLLFDNQLLTRLLKVLNFFD